MPSRAILTFGGNIRGMCAPGAHVETVISAAFFERRPPRAVHTIGSDRRIADRNRTVHHHLPTLQVRLSATELSTRVVRAPQRQVPLPGYHCATFLLCYAPRLANQSFAFFSVNTLGGNTMGATRPPMDYLANCSKASLESLELSRLNVAANLRKQFHQILNELIDSEVDARLARTILEWRRAAHHAVEQDASVPALPLEESVVSSLLPVSRQLSIAFEIGQSEAFECRGTGPNLQTPPALQDAATSSDDADFARPHRPDLSHSPLLAQAAAASGAGVEPLGERRCGEKGVGPPAAVRRVVSRTARTSPRDVNPVRDARTPTTAGASFDAEPIRALGLLLPTHVARVLFYATVAVAKQLA